MWKIADIEKNKIKYFENAASGKTITNIMDCIDYANAMSREIYLNNLTPASAETIEKIIRFWNNIDNIEPTSITNRKPINIYIDSFGGSLNAAFTIVDIIKNSKTPVYTINIGVCQKEALYPYLAGHKRYAYPRSSFYLDKNIERLDLSEGQSNYEDFIKKQALEVKDMVLEATKITETDYENRKGWWLTADKANELLVCHEVLRNKII